MAATVVRITGQFRNALGALVTSGRLYIKPPTFQPASDGICIPVFSIYNLPVGAIALDLIPGVYVVELDPDPVDPRPRQLKSGYFKTTWTVPASGPVDIALL